MALSPKSVFITGANRGIGLGLVKGFIALDTPPSHVFATCRNPNEAKDLKNLAEEHNEIHIIKLDVTDYAGLPPVVAQVDQLVAEDGLNLLINNAGILDRNLNSLAEVSPEHLRREYETNAIAPVMITQSLLPLLKRAAAVSKVSGMSCSKAAILNMTSRMGSVADNGSGGRYPYRASKAALNIITKSMSVDLKDDHVLATVLHPGFVLTDMGGPAALITVEECVEGLFKVMLDLDENKTGTFYHSNGTLLPW